MEEEPRPQASNGAAYLAIIGMSALLCFAWLLTGSLVLTLIIIALGSLHLARHFPDAERFVAGDPLLLWLRRFAPAIIICLVTVAAAVRTWR